MKLKEVPVGKPFRPTSEWSRFRMPGDVPIPEKMEVVYRSAGDAIRCQPLGGGDSVYFYGELEVTR